jgi:hypothetical protein
MLERSAEIDNLAARIFLAEHFCSRDIQAPQPSEPVGEVRVWMELNDFDQAPLAGSNGKWIILRSELADQPAQRPIGALAKPTPSSHHLDGELPLRKALDALAEHSWLLVRHQDRLIGILTRHDLASPVVTAYLMARLLGLEHGLRRLYGSFSHNPLGDQPEEPEEDRPALSLARLLNQVAIQKELRAALGFSSRNRFDDVSGRIVSLRNHLAHGRSLLALTPEPRSAVERIQQLEHLVASMQKLLTDRDHVWDAFASTEISDQNETNPLVWAGANAAPLPLAAPVHVVTAQNPSEQVLSDQVNHQRHKLLEKYLLLRAPSAQLQEVVGRSTQGSWAEASWAISGLARADALAIAQRFQQRAIFELTEHTMRVIAMDGSIRREVPRNGSVTSARPANFWPATSQG